MKIYEFLAGFRGFALILFIVIIFEIIILNISISNKKVKKVIKKEEVVHKIQFKTIEEKPKPKPKAKPKLVKKPKEKPKPKPQKPNKQVLLEKKQQKNRLEKQKEELKKKKLLEKIKADELKKKKLKKKQKQKEEAAKQKEEQRLDGIKTGYVNGIRNKMQRFQKYPLISKARREEGTVYISFTVNKDGSISNIKINKSSGFKRLDKAALKIFRRMGTGFNIPSDLKEEQMNLVLPVIFKLK